MDKLFGQFSLQNILRQMFCGVVFLLPFFLFSAIVAVKEPPVTFQNVCINLHKLNLSAVEFTSLAVLSIIIGTLIYHLEKNLWSYGLQIIFKRIQNKTLGCGGNRIMSICSLHAFSVLLIVATAWIFGSIKWFSGITFIVIAFAAALVAIVCISNGIVEDTETMWLAEGGGDSSHKGSLLDAQGLRSSIIMSKVSTWSDFIHCGQSCALAWILGSCSAYTLFEKADVLFGFFWVGILSSVSLLVAEGFIDWHRWQLVLCAINKVSSNKQKPEKKSENHGCICGCLLTLVIALFIVIVPVIPLLAFCYLFSNLISPKS